MQDCDGIILAAGLSSRAGDWKMGLELQGRPLIVHSVCNMHTAVERVIVVGGYRIGDLRRLLAPFPFVEIVENRDWESGMFSSVRTGVRSVTAGNFFLSPGDIPYIAPGVFRTLWAQPSAPVRIPVCNGRKGHPVLCGAEVIQAVAAAPEDSNLKEVLSRFPVQLVPVEDDGMLFDLDTPQDFRALQQFRQ